MSRKLKKVEKPIIKALIKDNLINRHIYKIENQIVKHGQDKTKKKGHQAYIAVTTTSNFHSEDDLINHVLRTELQRLNVKPVVEIDPSTIKIDIKPMSPSEKAFMLARKYQYEDPTYTLKQIYQKHRSKEMSQANIDVVHNIVMSIKAATKKVEV